MGANRSAVANVSIETESKGEVSCRSSRFARGLHRGERQVRRRIYEWQFVKLLNKSGNPCKGD